MDRQKEIEFVSVFGFRPEVEFLFVDYCRVYKRKSVDDNTCAIACQVISVDAIWILYIL